MRVLVISSKYPPEYSGSGHRAHATYKRLSKKYGVEFSVLSSSIESNGVKAYSYDGVSVQRVALKVGSGSVSGRSGLMRRIAYAITYCITYWLEALATFYYLIKWHSRFDLMHVFGKVNVTSAALIYSKITKKPTIVELVNLSDNPHQYEPLIFRLFPGGGLPKHAKIVCISEYLNKVCLLH